MLSAGVKDYMLEANVRGISEGAYKILAHLAYA